MTGKYALLNPGDPHHDDNTLTVETNTAGEILGAMREYVDEMENPGSSEIDRGLEDLWPSYSGPKIATCHISPAYVRDYYREIEAGRTAKEMGDDQGEVCQPEA
jgi:hypothetical protein